MPEMKNSGIEWIGDIPSHWAVLRNKYNFDLNKNIVGTAYKDAQLLSLTKNGVKAITEDDQKGKVPTSFATYQTVDKDDIVMCLFDLDVSAVFSGVSPYEGMISPAYKCFKCKEHLCPQYIDYYFRTVFVDRKYKRYSKNVRYSIGADEFMSLPILAPPLEVQQSIANFLDKKCSEIDSLSADIQSQIDILEEYKKSVITEVVTKGLNPDVEMKDSGIEWIGMIPKHWSVLRIKQMCSKITDGSHFSPTTVDSGKKYLTAANVNNDIIDTKNTKEISANDFNILVKTGCRPQKNDVLLTKDGSVGRTAVVTDDNDYVILSSIGILTPNSNTDSVFLKYSIDGNYLQHQMLQSMQGAALKRITISKIMEYKNIVPPIEEQKEIANYLLVKCAEIDAVIADKKEQLETLAEHKKSLIYEYVTGKKEVL